VATSRSRWLPKAVTPLLIHIGYHKTATNWFQEPFFGNPASGYQWLGKKPLTHPLHRIIRDRPLNFDAVAVQRKFEQLIAKAEAAGLVPVLSSPRLSGHSYSGGYDSKELADRLKQVFPEARILIVIREQRSMIASTYKQYVKAGGSCTLNQFLDPEWKRGFRVPGFNYSHFEYDLLIAYYQSQYGAENVLALPYELFVRDGRDFVERVAQFAGRPVPDEVLAEMPYTQRFNPGRSALAVTIARPLNRISKRSDMNPAPLFGISSARVQVFRNRILGADLLHWPVIRALASRHETRFRLSVEKAVGDRYVQSNRTTAELTGVDLAEYGWMV
jgi:sulfotransferase family protein